MNKTGIEKFQDTFFNRNISVNIRGKLMKISRLIVKSHSEGTVSQISFI